MIKAFRVVMKVELMSIEDDKAAGGTIHDVLVYEKDFGKTIDAIVQEVVGVVEKNG